MIRYSDLKTGDASVDRAGIRLPILRESIRHRFTVDEARAAMAIARKESAGNERYYLGDTAAPGGPSIGPMQVYRQTAIDLGLWPTEGEDPSDRDAYAALATDEQFGIKLGMAVFRNKLDLAGGDLADAIRRYNGSGPAAESYRNQVVSFLNSAFGQGEWA